MICILLKIIGAIELAGIVILIYAILTAPTEPEDDD